MMAPATTTAIIRNSGLDKPTRRRTLSEGRDDPKITYSVKDRIKELSDKIDDLRDDIQKDTQLADRRLNILEQNAMLVEQHTKMLESVLRDFQGFEIRFRDHERNLFHTTGDSTISRLCADVDNLKVGQLTQQAVKDFTDEMVKARKADRHWLIGVSITLAIFVAREVLPFVVRASQIMPSQTMP